MARAKCPDDHRNTACLGRDAAAMTCTSAMAAPAAGRAASRSGSSSSPAGLVTGECGDGPAHVHLERHPGRCPVNDHRREARDTYGGGVAAADLQLWHGPQGHHDTGGWAGRADPKCRHGRR
jgi:hypothetical protein